MATAELDACKILKSMLSSNEKKPDATVRTVVRFLEILPGSRCRVRGPNGLAIYILKVPSQLCQTYFEPGIYLGAKIKRVSVRGKVAGVVTSILGQIQIAELLVAGLWPNAFIEAEYISEKVNELLELNSRNRVSRRR